MCCIYAAWFVVGFVLCVALLVGLYLDQRRTIARLDTKWRSKEEREND